MNSRNGLIAAGVVALLALIGVLIQSGNLSQSETKLEAVQTTATAQQAIMTDQWVQAQATLSAAGTQAASNQQKALEEAAQAAATAQAQALGETVNAASTVQAQALAAADHAAATQQAIAVTDANKAAATTQAQAVGEAVNAAATQQAQTVTTMQAEATATLGVIIRAAITSQAQATATLAAIVDAAATAQAQAVTDTLHTAATAQAQAEATLQSQAVATLQRVLAINVTDVAGVHMTAEATYAAAATRIAALNAELATAQAAVPVSPTPESTAVTGAAPADWKRYVGKGVAIQLPNTYVGSELGSDPKTLGKLLRSLGPDFEAGATLLESNPDILSFIAVNPGSGPQNPSASIIILNIDLPVNVPLEALLQATVSQLPRSATVMEKGVVTVGEYKAGRMIIETQVGSLRSIQLQYYIIANNALYLVGFTGTPEYFDTQLPLFEQMMKTFEILAKPGI